MTRILILLAGLFFAGESFALPKCPAWRLMDGIVACTYTWADGRKYVGEFKADKRWEGIRYHASGTIWGTYSNGERCKGCKPTARQLAIVREIDPSQIATTPASSKKNKSWCATEDATWSSVKGCRSGVKAFSTEAQAKAEHKRLKAASSKQKVWCATKDSVLSMSKYYCDTRSGKAYPSEYQAQAEHQRLKKQSSISTLYL